MDACLSDERCLVSDFCSSGRDFAPRFLHRFLAVPPLRFASASPPSGYTGDFHPKLSDMSDTQAGASPRPRFAACGFDRMSPARQRLL